MKHARRMTRPTTLMALAAAFAVGGSSQALASYTPPGTLDCPISQRKAKNGAKPSKTTAQKVIRCLFERRGDDTREAHKVVVKSYAVGQKRKWRQSTTGSSDLGNGRPGTWVWPIKVRWVWSKYYTDHTLVQDNLSVFNCFVNTFGEWECGLAQRIKDGQLERKPAIAG